jgi:energy-converting hydrogenase Eha subunit B
MAVFVVEFDAYIALEHGGNVKGAARVGRQAVWQSRGGGGSGGFSHGKILNQGLQG